MADSYDTLILSESSLIDYYQGDTHTSSSMTDSKGSNNLALSGTFTLDKAELLPAMTAGKSIGFATGQGTKTSASGMPSPSGGLTVECWVKPAANTGEQILFGCDCIYVECFNANLYCDVKAGGSTYAAGGIAFTVGNTYHLVGTFDGASTASLYINGSLAATAATSGSVTIPTFLTLGAWWNGTSAATADIERAAFYSSALSPTAILNHYNTGAGTPPAPPDAAGAYDSYDQAIMLEAALASYIPGDAHSSYNLLDLKGTNHLALTGGYTVDKTPLLPRVPTGKAVGFSTGRAVKTSATGLPAPSQGMTVECWVKPAANTGTQILFGCDRIYLEQFNTNLYGVVVTTAATTTLGAVGCNTGTVYYIATTWDGAGNQTLYVNGVKLAGTIASPSAANPTFVTMGAWWNGTNPSTADIQRCAIYTGALTDAQILRHYQAGRGAVIPTPTTTRAPSRISRRTRLNQRLPARPAGNGYRGFSARSLPGPNDKPFSPTAVWNLSADSASVHPSSSAIVSNVLATFGNPGVIVVGKTNMGLDDFSHPIYYAEPTDPLYTVTCTGNPNNILAGEKIRVPALAKPAKGSDGHLCVVQPDGWAYDFWQAVKNDATFGLTATNGSKQRIDGSGRAGAATAAHFDLPAGEIRYEELAAGRVEHALFCVLAGCAKFGDFGFGVQTGSRSDWVYPASAGDSYSTATTAAHFAPMGAWMRLNYTDVEISALSVPDWRKTIIRALARHGAFVGDTGGSGFQFHFASGASYVAFGVPDPFVAFARAQGIAPNADGTYSFDVATGVDWAGRLQILQPPSP